MNIFARLTCAFSFLSLCFSGFASYIAITKTYAPDSSFVYPKLKFYQTTEKVLKDYTSSSLTLITPMIDDELKGEDRSKVLKKELYVYIDKNKQNHITETHKPVVVDVLFTIDDLKKQEKAAEEKAKNATVSVRKLTQDEKKNLKLQ